MTCPMAFELVLYAEGRLPEDARERIDRHLRSCTSCRALHKGIVPDAPGQNRHPTPERIRRSLLGCEPLPQKPDIVEQGQVWLASDVPGTLVIVDLIEDADVYATYALSTETAYLGDRDVWLAAEENPLGVNAMVLTWLNLPVDRKALDVYIGTLERAVTDRLQRFRAGLPNEGDLQRVGPPVTDSSDPRFRFQESEMSFWEPVSQRIRRRMATMSDEEAATSQEIEPNVVVFEGNHPTEGLIRVWVEGGRLQPVEPMTWYGTSVQILLPGMEEAQVQVGCWLTLPGLSDATQVHEFIVEGPDCKPVTLRPRASAASD